MNVINEKRLNPVLSCNSEEHGWGRGSGGDSHWVQPQIQGRSLFGWRGTLLLGFKLLLQLRVKVL